jgi:surface protein
MEDMFTYNLNLLKIDLSNFDTSLVTSMKHMFMYCFELTSVNLSGFNTRLVKGFNAMFQNCYNLVSIDLSSFDTSNSETFNNFFDGCEKLETILQNFDTSKCINANGMFSGCKSLVSLDISNFDLSNNANMGLMFQNCENLEYLHLNQLITLNSITDISYLFSGCKKLQSLDLSFLDTSNVINMASLFYNCENLKYLNILNFDYSMATNISNMFDGCKSLQYLNMHSFIENTNSEKNNIFNNINQNLFYCIKDTSKATNIISLLNSKNAKNDCSHDCFFKNVTFIPEEEICIQNCDNYEYKYRYNNKCFTACNHFYSFDQKECIDLIPEGYYLNSSSLKTIDKCPMKCESCSYESMENNLCTSCKNRYLKIDIDSFCDCTIYCPAGYIYKNTLYIIFKLY